ncbi:MAG: hypothetical protein LH465_09880 [Sphingomonas bacterium]|nr:hypothetical protein [Sphingomonas bacterium]
MNYRIALYVVLLIAALWLLAVNSGLADRARSRLAYADLVAQRDNERDPSRPIMLAQYDREDRLVPAGATVLIGDSIAFKAPFMGRCIANRGIGGERSDQLLANLGRWSSLRRAGAVVIAIGTNDVWQHRPEGLGERVAAIVERIDAPIFVLGLSARLRGVPEANRALRRACRGRCTFVEPTGEVAPDGIHLSPRDYLNLAARLPRECDRANGATRSESRARAALPRPARRLVAA